LEVAQVDPHPDNTSKILELLLRCGMISREELNVVLELMSERFDRRALVVQEPESKPRQDVLILEFD
jgi:hypothetical protein